DGVNLGLREIKFCRPSELIDPMSSVEWEPVRARDPRIRKVLQAFAAEKLIPIPPSYALLAVPPEKVPIFSAPNTGSPSAQPNTTQQPAPGATPPPGTVRPPGSAANEQ